MFNRTLTHFLRLPMVGALLLCLQISVRAQVTPPHLSERLLAGPTRLAAERDQLYRETGDTLLVDRAVAEYLRMHEAIYSLCITEQAEGDASSRFEPFDTEKSSDDAAEGGMDCTFAVPDSLLFCPTSKFATTGCSNLKMPTDWVVALGIQQEINGICPAGPTGTVALMVQSILWRTYGVKRNLEGKPANQGQAVALVGAPDLRCMLAAQMTSGQVMLGSKPNGHDYGKLIFAAYSARCNGDKTRSAKNGVWHNTGTCSEGGTTVSYLQSVTCSGHDSCDGTGETPCCGTNDGQSIYGHGAGTCQRGIVAFAKLGWTYKQILLHYFSDEICITKPTACILVVAAPTVAKGCDYVTLTAQTPTSGTPPYSYHWSTGETSQSIDMKTKGTYTVTVADAVCSAERSVKSGTIPQGSPFQVTAVPTHPDCTTGTLGRVLLTGTKNNWASEWSDGQITIGKLRNHMPAGDYSVTVVNNKGCTATANVTLIGKNCGPTITMSTSDCNTRWLKPVVPTDISVDEYWWNSPGSAISNTRADSLPVWLPGEYFLRAVTSSGDTLTAKYNIDLSLWDTYRPLALVRPYSPCSSLTLNGSAVADISWPYMGTGELYLVDGEGPHYNSAGFTESIRTPGAHTFTTIYSDGCEVSSQYTIETKYSTSTDIPISIVGDSLVADLSGMGIPAEFTDFEFFWSMRDSATGWYKVFVDATVQSLRNAIPITENGTYKLQVRNDCDQDYTLFGEIHINYLVGSATGRNEWSPGSELPQKESEEISVAPNPTTGVSTISGAYGEVLITSIDGRTIAHANSNGSAHIDLNAQPPGIYIARICDTNGVVHTLQIVKTY
jgi:hypothetical protein